MLKRNGMTEKVLWQHPQYRMPPVSIHTVDETHGDKHYCLEAKVNQERHALFRSWEECRKWCNLFEIAPRVTEGCHEKESVQQDSEAASTQARKAPARA
jgi:hypothetical protein